MIFEFLKANNQSGYIALISIIIIAILLITIGVVISFGGFFTRFSILENEYKEISVDLAEACGEFVIAKLAENWFYMLPPGGETMTVGTNNCQIVSIQDSGLEKIIRTQAIYQKSYTNLEIKVSRDISNINIKSWKEVTNFN